MKTRMWKEISNINIKSVARVREFNMPNGRSNQIKISQC